MRKIGQFILGAAPPLLWAATELYLIKTLKIRATFSVVGLLALIALQILLSWLFFRVLRNRSARYGVFFGNILPLAFFGISLWLKIDFTPNVHFSNNRQSSSASNVPPIQLSERITQANLGVLSDTLAISVTSYKGDKLAKGDGQRINSLVIDFSNFQIQPNKEWRETSSKFNFEIINDSLFTLYLPNEKVIQKLNVANKTDSVSYIGYLPRHRMFVFIENVSEMGPDYFAIDAISGQRLNGVPLYSNSKGDLFANVSFQHFIGDVDAILQVWKKSEGNYILLMEKGISTNKFLDSTGFEVSHSHWDKNDFFFAINIDGDIATVKVHVF